MSIPKVVLHLMSSDGPDSKDFLYGVGGRIHRDLERLSGLQINFVSFYGVYLHGAELERFVRECSDAQVVITDAWNHPNNEDYGSREWDNAHRSMLWAVQAALRANPRAVVFSELMEGQDRVDVHKVAKSFKDFADLAEIAQAIRQSVVKEGRPWVLVFDDSKEHRDAAVQQLNEFNTVVVECYDRAEDLIKAGGFDYVLLDLLVPACARTLGGKGLEYVGQEMPITPILAFLALGHGVKRVAVLTDAGHHNHPASAALDAFDKTIVLGDAKILLTNRDFVSNGVKQWDRLKAALDE